MEASAGRRDAAASWRLVCSAPGISPARCRARAWSTSPQRPARAAPSTCRPAASPATTGRARCALARAPEQYGAIHFHDDDLDDASWKPTSPLTCREDLRSGDLRRHLQRGRRTRITCRSSSARRAARRRRRSPSWCRPPPTWPMPTTSLGRPPGDRASSVGQLWMAEADDLFLQRASASSALSTYDRHGDGSGVCHSSRLRPILNMRPKRPLPLEPQRRHATSSTGSRRPAIAYDVITDEDLHRGGARPARALPRA